MIAEFGHFALILALMVSLGQASLPLLGAQRQDTGLMALGSFSAITAFSLVATSFIALAWSFVIDDFSVVLVAANSQTTKPLIYKITGVWANHEGS
ncbi:MAG: heme lyase NrfEFG subunit NrfE, partial [Aestuariivirga sp.]